MSFPRQQARTRRFSLGVPRAFQISPDGRRVTFLRGRHGLDPATCLWLLDLDSGRERVVADPRELGRTDEDLPPEERARRERLRETGGGVVSYTVDDGLTRAAFTLSGRLYHVDLVGDGATARELPVTGPVVDPVIDPRGEAVAYVSGGAIHVVTIADGNVRTLTGPEGEGVTWGLAEFIAAEEMGRYRGMWWAPDGSALLAARVDDSPVARWHIGDPAHPETAPQVMAYPAAGTANAEVRLAVLPLGESAEGPAKPAWIDWDREALPYLVTAGWTTGPDGTPTVVFTAQSRDQRSMTVFSADPATGLVFDLLSEDDDTWVEIMPGVPAFTAGGDLVWIGARGEDRERHLYVAGRAVEGRGHYVRGLVDVDGGLLLYSGSVAGSPGDVGLWLLDVTEGGALPVEFPGASTGGVHSGRLRGGTLVLQRRDLENDGVRTVAIREAASETRRSVTPIDSFAETPDLPAPRVRMWAAGERRIPSALLLPSWYESGSGPLPVLMDPYGGPHAQRVLRARGAYLTSQWFAEQGFAVLVADGRGTPGIGLEWEQAISGDLASAVLEDQVAALHDAAARSEDLDLDRVAIRGWSFGGYLAALAVLRRPDVFHAAVAGAPVTDWRLYDTHYTERYLGLPQERPDAYAASSLLGDAPNLRRPLMLIHGLADDNVAFAHSQRLSSALLAAGRPHTVLPLSGITHMPTEESTAENLLLLQVEFLREALRGEGSGS
ncbi:dipeptidyl-peptidase-4 [Marinactinospora thermotolerans DSM 45154]|uniref:Dipeptidyl-peptidase-4 n=1 Tax=Marinactinospora thermotolerans DSM 45154 TaxID=1122192 RepID=A0A1T4SY13_9ACTN|nr:prolyl oligopeptidase family serine peptidase [Marinactinospora thermotolerans]SKA32798.1 dipeptidyl-peptidase-4 [Marinactinospora thermotolerans DSM 45154]